jgi:succinate dehydrogenase / fumarate reductase cytochrome b subunit
MADFWLHTKKSLYITHENENPFKEVKEAMTKWYILIPYLLGFFSLGFHLLHGFPSAFQTLGLNHKKYTPIIHAAGVAFSVIVPGLFGVIALALFFGIVR